MNILIANFGNDSLGLIQYVVRLQLKEVVVVSVDTGFGNPVWQERIVQAQDWVSSLGFTSVRLQPKLDFAKLVQAQGEFPSTRFQWCATYLKGDTLRAWLSETDPLKTATVLLARRRSQSPQFSDLPEFVEGAEEFADRRIWHPLINTDEKQLQGLVRQTPFAWMPHRSLECDPCVNSDAADVLRLSTDLIERVSRLETLMQEPFLPELYQGETSLKAALPNLKPGKSRFLFDMGCGSPYGCGL